MRAGNYPFLIELHRPDKTGLMHWSVTQRCAVLRLALVDSPNELQNTCNLIYWKAKTLSFVGEGRAGNYALPSWLKRWPKPGQFSGEVPSALLDCFSLFLAIPWTSSASLESPPPSLMIVCALGWWSRSQWRNQTYISQCFRSVQYLEDQRSLHWCYSPTLVPVFT